MWLPCETIVQNRRFLYRENAIYLSCGPGEWDQRLDMGNPVTDKALKDYLRVVTMEQLQARVQPKQATPFFIDKLEVVIELAVRDQF